MIEWMKDSKMWECWEKSKKKQTVDRPYTFCYWHNHQSHFDINKCVKLVESYTQGPVFKYTVNVWIYILGLGKSQATPFHGTGPGWKG